MKSSIIRSIQILAIGGVGVFSMLATGVILGETPAHALPEYADRTGEPCSTCHVNPGGGGPRTFRGLLWVAQGRPEAVPEMGNVLIAPGVNDGVALYDSACSSCHGESGEGLFGIALVSSGITEDKIQDTILRGRERSGMPAFEGLFTSAQLSILVEYVTGISSGEIEPAPLSYPLPAAEFTCDDQPDEPRCGGN